MDLFQRAKAQGIDDVVSPTIPFEPPDGPIATAAPTTAPEITGPNIQLEANATNISVGDVFRVEVIVDSAGEEIREYSIQISFDNEFLEVIDFDTATPGTQIDFLDPFSAPTENIAANDSGTISIQAESEVGSSTISNRTVAAIEFQGIAEGFTDINVNTNNSLLIDIDSVDVLESTNSVSITVQTEGAEPIDTTTPLPTTPGGVPLPSQTPDTALLDGSNPGASIIFGTILMLSGYFIWKQRKNHEQNAEVQ